MTIKAVRCDYCHEICKGDSFTVFRNDKEGWTKGRSDYCEECWNKAHTPLPITPYKRGGRE